LDKPSKTQASITLGGNVQEDKTIENGELAPVHNGPEPARGMSFEICDRHLATRDEGGNSTEESDCDGNSGAELDYSGKSPLYIMQLLPSAQNAKEFLCAMAGEEEAYNDAHDGVDDIRKISHDFLQELLKSERNHTDSTSSQQQSKARESRQCRSDVNWVARHTM